MRRRGQERREERQEDRRPGPGPAAGGQRHYKMRQKLVSIGDDFFIEDERGVRVFHVDGKALRVRDTLLFKDMEGHELYRIQTKMLRIKDTMDIESAGGGRVASVKKALITPVRERWTVNIAGGRDLDVQGNILDHEYTIGEGRDRVAEVSKKWFRIADSYGIEVSPGQNDALILAIAVVIDNMAHGHR